MDYSLNEFYNDYDDLYSFPVYCYNRYKINGLPTDIIFNSETDIQNYLKNNCKKEKDLRYITLELPNRKIKIYGRTLDFIYKYIKENYMEII